MGFHTPAEDGSMAIYSKDRACINSRCSEPGTLGSSHGEAVMDTCHPTILGRLLLLQPHRLVELFLKVLSQKGENGKIPFRQLSDGIASSVKCGVVWFLFSLVITYV